MKGNKEFIDGVYKKYEEYQDGKKFKKVTPINKSSKKNLTKVLSIAAMAAIVITGVNIGNNIKTQQLKNKLSKTTTSNALTLKTVDNFETLYNIAKENSKNNSRIYESEDLDFSASSSLSDLSDASKASVSESKTTTANSDYSKTNIQVENVDEADVVKTDGKYIYYISNNKVVIIDINKPEELNKISEITYTGDSFIPSELYISENKLIVLGNKNKYNYNKFYILEETSDSIYKKGEYKQKSVAIIYDLSNIEKPRENRRIEIDGNYISSRMIDDDIYFVSNKNIYAYSLVEYEYKDLDENKFKPSYVDTANGDTENYIDFKDIHYFENTENLNYLSIAGFDIDSDENVNIETFLGAGEDIYSSDKNMYITKSKTVFDADSRKYLGEDTKILKFNLNNGKITFKAEVNIEGKINNQFSMDENEKGEFRIATTIGDVDYNISESESTNSLFVLDESLNEIGRIDGIAPGEKIYSVRYSGDKAYMVTFYEMDPLFVIDLSDSKNPKILGELKIPGYSSYLHPYDETHLIGFGYDTKSNYDNSGVVRDGLKMSMFDISDLENPKEMFTIKIGDNRTSSELTDNHKALLFSKEKNFIAFPVSGYANGKYESKAQVYDIDLEKGFTLKGEIEHEKASYTNKIQRIIYSKDVFYTLSQSLIKATDMNSLQEITKLNF